MALLLVGFVFDKKHTRCTENEGKRATETFYAAFFGFGIARLLRLVYWPSLGMTKRGVIFFVRRITLVVRLL